jgi:exopolyphosphatase/guanosine-5'-triphosphate,3'-diphosphate pyrophosphatase
VRDENGLPVVIRNAPLLEDGTPMPTRYWLVSKQARLAVDRLEAAGGVRAAEAAVDPEELVLAHARYAAERDGALPPGWDGPRPSGGVGGTRKGVKCLHAHYASWLAGDDDPVGRWVAHRLGDELPWRLAVRVGVVGASGPAGVAAGPAAVGPSAVGPSAVGPSAGPTSSVNAGAVGERTRLSGERNKRDGHLGNVAAVDCGTLSTRLLVAGPDGRALVRLMRITGLGQGVDSAGRLAPAATERVLAVLREYRGVMDEYGVADVAMVGTSALRDAANRAEFSEKAAAVAGTELQLLEGEAEAALSFLGATSELDPAGGPWLVADIGGGSTELASGPPLVARSLDLGCVRVTERFLRHDPPTPVEQSLARSWLVEKYRAAEASLPGLRGARSMVGLAGTVAALAAFDQSLATYSREAVHHYRLVRAAVERALSELAAQPAAGRAGRPGIEAARAPYIVGGTLVLDTLMEHFGFDECLTSEADILDGLVIELLAS